MTIPMANAGLQRLIGLKDVLANTKGAAFGIWHERRWEIIEEGLSLWCHDSVANQLIDKYADLLADDLLELLNAGHVSAAADAAMDSMEELFAQAREFHRTQTLDPDPETSASSVVNRRSNENYR